MTLTAETTKNLRTDVAELLLKRQPEAIRSRLQESNFLEGLGIRTYSGISIGDSSALLRHLLKAAKEISPDQPERKLSLVGGEEALLTETDGGLALSVQKGDQRFQSSLDFLGLASEDRSERRRVAERVGEQLGPTSDVAKLRAIAEERPLSEKEMESLVVELSQGVAGFQSRLHTRMQREQLTLGDLVPDSLAYYEGFCGPDPGDLPPEEYLSGRLPAYRKELLQRDLRGGLHICLLGAFRDDLCPGSWLESVDDESLWTALVECQPALDPISLFAALDLALYRFSDDRFRSFAEDAVRQLAGDHFLRPDDVDAYDLIPLLARFFLNRIQLMEGGALRSPFWKRMCAWMQASFVARLLAEADIELDAFSRAVRVNYMPAGELASTLDLRKEPMLEAGSMSPMALRREVVGRLIHLGSRSEARNTPMPRFEEVEQAWERLAKVPPPLSWGLPGPLEGHRQPHLEGKLLSEDLKAQLRELSGGDFIANLGNLSQHFGLDEETKQLLRDAILRETSTNEAGDLKRQLVLLLHLGAIAAAERDSTLAMVGAEGVLRLAPGLQDENMVWAAVETLLRSAAAFEDETSCAGWLERQFFEFASRLPAGKPSATLWRYIQELKKVTRLELGIFRRAEGAASAAASL